MRKYSVTIHQVTTNGGSLEEQVAKKYVCEIFDEVIRNYVLDSRGYNPEFMEYLSKELTRVLVRFYSNIPEYHMDFISSFDESLSSFESED